LVIEEIISVFISPGFCFDTFQSFDPNKVTGWGTMNEVEMMKYLLGFILEEKSEKTAKRFQHACRKRRRLDEPQRSESC
jgi:hypothetical protein